MAPGAEGPEAVRAEELAEIVRRVRDRVRARYPQTSAGPVEVPLPDLMPIVHARDAAESKVAAIGTVNPRPGGILNAAIQAVKRLVARALDWHVREQVEFNRNLLGCVEATVEALNDVNRALVEMGTHIGALRQASERLEEEIRRSTDVRHHWAEWRVDWERKLADNERQFLRSVADLQAAFQHRTTLTEASFRKAVEAQHQQFTAALQAQHGDFAAALEAGTARIQEHLWADMEKVRLEYQRLIHAELRLVRQRAAAAPAAAVPHPAPQPPPAPGDGLAFAARFRGPEEYVRERQRFYLPWFTGRRRVLDVGCGRGEFLELMRDAGAGARGIDLDPAFVALCRGKGLEAEAADLFEYLGALPEASLDGLFCAHVIEHLPPARLGEFVALAASRLERGGVLAIESPNPECLAIFTAHFYLDPTHTRPVPAQLLAFLLEEAGCAGIELHRLSPAVESMPSLASLPEEFRDAFFGGLDYAVTAQRL